MKIDNEHSIGDIVYLKTDPEMYARMVLGIIIRFGSPLIYELRVGAEPITEHAEIEISKNKDVM